MTTSGNLLELVEQETALEMELPAWYGRQEALSPRRGWYVPVKVAMEWLLALGLLVGFSPLLLALALMVKLTSRGPIFYTQTRLGRYGRRYRMYKLRTMVQDAEAATGPVWAARNDVRITPVGSFLRKTHLDEMPQLWNILCGEMSLIGPRPERPEIAARIERQLPAFRYRLQVRPGVTGLAQMILPADDPGDTSCEGAKGKLAHDLYYAREISFLMDLRIALSTWFYFAAEIVHAVHRGFVRPYAAAVKRESAPVDDQQEACGNAV